MKLKETIQIRYKSIIDHGHNEKVKDVYEGEAVHELSFQEESYFFKHGTFGQMSIKINGGRLELRHGATKMEMVYQTPSTIHYQTPYGTLQLTAHLKKLSRTSSNLQIVYYLYDNQELLSKCYLMIDKINPMLS